MFNTPVVQTYESTQQGNILFLSESIYEFITNDKKHGGYIEWSSSLYCNIDQEEAKSLLHFARPYYSPIA